MVWWQLLLSSVGIGVFYIKYRISARHFKEIVSLTNKTMIITGATSGIGKKTAYELAKRNARVIMACRDVTTGKKIMNDLRYKTKCGEFVVMKLDLSSFESIDTFVADVASKEKAVDVLINNAGVFQCPYLHTKDGFEMQMGVNHFGHFRLTQKLSEIFTIGRIIVVSSSLSKFGTIDFENLNSQKDYDKKKAYSNSKLANNMFAIELSKKMHGTVTSVHCLSPGMCRTNLGRHVVPSDTVMFFLYPLYWLVTRSAWEGAQTVLYCASSSELDSKSGKYYKDCKEVPWHEKDLDSTVSLKLWDISSQMCELSS